MSSSVQPTIIVHGGAYNIRDEHVADNLAGVQKAVSVGYNALLETNDSISAVVKAISQLEDNPAFDAGHGSVLNVEGQIEMDCLLMRGDDQSSVSIMAIDDVFNPIQVAEQALLSQRGGGKTQHFIGERASKAAAELNVKKCDWRKLVTEEGIQEWQRLVEYKHTINDVFRPRQDPAVSRYPSDTVGCVAIDKNGNISCGTSTGGITAKMVGRVGDTPIVGAGGYCLNGVGGVSTTGHGEAFTKCCLAYQIVHLMSRGKSPCEAAREALSEMAERVEGGHGGAICINNQGDIGMWFNTPRMVWACMKDDKLLSGINSNDHPSTSLPPLNTISGIAQENTNSLDLVEKCILISDFELSTSIKNVLQESWELAKSDTSACEIAVLMAEKLTRNAWRKGDSYEQAMVMDGKSLNAAMVLDVQQNDDSNLSAVTLANSVMCQTPHTLVVGEGLAKLSERWSIDLTCSAVNTEDRVEALSDRTTNKFAVLVVIQDNAACVYSSTSKNIEDTHTVLIGGCGYSDVKQGMGGCCMVLTNNKPSMRHLPAKAVTNLLVQGATPEEALFDVKDLLSPVAETSLAALDIHGNFAIKSTKTAKFHNVQFN